MTSLARMVRSAIAGASLLVAAGMGMPDASLAQQAPVGDKAFAEHFIALQLSDHDARKESEVLNVANNLLKAYGPDTIAIEVVAFGPGIHLLYADSPDRKRVDSLIAQGVRFNICGNTLDTIERETGKRPAANPNVIEVKVGVGYLLSLAEKGYTVVRP